MIELNGKYSNAYIYASIVDEETYGQIIKVINSSVSENSRLAIMADCHAGAGCVIGTTMIIKDRVCPNLVGVDIGCGMLSINLGKIEFNDELFVKFDEAVKTVPSGFGVHKIIPTNLWKHFEDYEKFFKKFLCYKSLKDVDRLIKSFGTLGGGNHFIELNKSINNDVYLVIHSGSRNLGKQVCDYYQNLALKTVNSSFKEREEIIERLKKENRYQDISDELEKLEKNLVRVPNELAYLKDENMKAYIHDLKLCQEFASYNRKMIAYQILMKFFKLNSISKWVGNNFKYAAKKESVYLSNMGVLNAFETIHNYIDLDKMILRKGAVSALLGEKLLIPINMKDGSLICVGKGNKDYNFSAPHGAGRLLSRSQAKELIKIEEYKDMMKGIYSTTVNFQTLDEAPLAYKPIDAILENIKDSVDIIEVIKPLYNFKAGDMID